MAVKEVGPENRGKRTGQESAAGKQLRRAISRTASLSATQKPTTPMSCSPKLTVSGDQINYPGNKSTPTADLTTVKLLLNSTISTPGAVFLGMDLANFYLNTPMPNPEYLRLRLDVIPEEIIVAYNIRDFITADGWVYITIHKGMYGLPQAGILANQLLEVGLSTPRRTVSCSMPGYIDTALKKYQHTKPTTPQHAPYQAAPIQYGLSH